MSCATRCCCSWRGTYLSILCFSWCSWPSREKKTGFLRHPLDPCRRQTAGEEPWSSSRKPRSMFPVGAVSHARTLAFFSPGRPGCGRKKGISGCRQPLQCQLVRGCRPIGGFAVGSHASSGGVVSGHRRSGGHVFPGTLSRLSSDLEQHVHYGRTVRHRLCPFSLWSESLGVRPARSWTGRRDRCRPPAFTAGRQSGGVDSFVRHYGNDHNRDPAGGIGRLAMEKHQAAA